MIFLPHVLRKIIHPLVSHSSTYFAGMVFIRIARKIRKRINAKNGDKVDFVQINNFASNIKMEVDKYSYMGGSIYWTGYHQLNELLYINKILQKDMTFIDVGANQGEFTLFAAKRLTEGTIISFEPVKSNLISLKKNIEINAFNNVEIVAKGLYNEKKDLPVYTSFDNQLQGGRNEGLSTIFPDNYRKDLEQIIELIPFDDYYYDQLKRFDFLKIDIEGAELFALQGMKKSIEKFHPQILMEINATTSKNAGYEVDELITYLSDLGYKSYVIIRGELREMNYTSNLEWDNFIFKYSA
jgi:FkbM family methyltransferase